MKRVLHILGGLKRGGIETFLLNLYRHIDKSKIQFDFLISDQTETDYTRYILESGGRIFYYVSRNRGVLANLKSLKQFYVEHSHEYDTVHYHASSLTNILPLYFAKKFNIKRRIIHSHNVRQGGGGIHKYLHFMGKIFLTGLVTNYLACSVQAAKWMYPKSVINKKLYIVVPNGISLEKFSFSETKREIIRRKLSLSESDIVIGNVARFHEQKNHSFLIDVFHELHKLDTNYKLVLVGEGALKSNIREKVKKLELDSQVVFYGESHDVASLMSAFDIFIMPSLYEGLGIVLIEAQASNLPCIVSKDVIPQEARVSTNYVDISLDKSPLYWAETIIDIKLNTSRSDIINKRLEEYDIKAISDKMMSFYLSCDNLGL